MKKSKKLTILFSIVTISVLVAIGCSNDNSSDEPEPTPVAAATEDTQTPEATNPPAQNPPAANPPAETPVSGSEEGNEQPACDDTASYGAPGSCHNCGDRHVDDGEVCDGENCRRDCSGCVDGYYLENGECVPNPVGCMDYDERYGCSTCEAGYTLNANRQCVRNIEEGNEESGCNCNSDCVSTGGVCNVASGTCVECLSDNHCGNGSICVNNTCVHEQSACTDGLIDNCIRVGGDNCDVCEACAEGYHLEDGVCVRDRD